MFQLAMVEEGGFLPEDLASEMILSGVVVETMVVAVALAGTNSETRVSLLDPSLRLDAMERVISGLIQMEGVVAAKELQTEVLFLLERL